MLTVKQASTSLGISNTTLRQRGSLYADYLSEFANPGKGKERRYTSDDITTLRTIGVLIAQQSSEDDILAALDAGEVLEPVDMPPGDETGKAKKTVSDDKALVTSEFAAALTSYETQVTSLQKKNDELHDRLLEMTERAIRAETKNQAVSILQDAETPAGDDVASQGGNWRQRLAKWISGEG